MAANTQNTSELLERTKFLMQKEETIRKKVKILNWAFPLLLLTVFFIFFSLFYSTVKNIDKEKFISKLQENSIRLWPKIGDEVARLGTNLYPHYAAEVERALSDSIPELEKQIAGEMEVFEQTLNEKISRDLSEAYGSFVKKQEQSLLMKIPELEGDEQKTKEALAVIQGASVNWVKQKINQAMQDHVVAFLDLRKILDSHYRLDLGEAQAVDPETLLSTWLEIMDATLLGESTLIEEPTPKKKRRIAAKRPVKKGGV